MIVCLLYLPPFRNIVIRLAAILKKSLLQGRDRIGSANRIGSTYLRTNISCVHCTSVCQSCSVIRRRINSFDSSLLALFLTLHGVRTWSTRPRGEPAFILVSVDRRTRPHCLQQRPLEKEVHREKGFVVVSSFEADRSPANQRSLKRIGRQPIRMQLTSRLRSFADPR